MAKLGRNQPCPCGSGRKYKKCHGGASRPVIDTDTLLAMQQHVRRMRQWEGRFGRVAPPSSALVGDRRVMILNGGLVAFPARSTFHDFLANYVVQRIGQAWFDGEAEKPFSARHPIAQWYEKAEQFHRRHLQGSSGPYQVEMEGVVGHYLTLAHDVFALDNSGLLQDRMVKRLLNSGNFQGARYELQVAAICLRAGAVVQLVDETDLSSSHCEFVVEFPSTGRKFSVEAKSRHRRGVLGMRGTPHPPGDYKPDILRHLENALGKDAEYERIVFFDLNIPPVAGNWQENGLADELTSQIMEYENLRARHGETPTPAVLVFTNRPAHFVGETDLTPSSAFLVTGIGIPEFRVSTAGPGGLELGLRAKWPEILLLHNALIHQSDVPEGFAFDERPS